jgi:ABC-type Fe3+/spermidine/putrescine transport system ATPase subunit
MLSIQIEGLHKRFGKTIAVQNLCLEIEEGEFISVLGPSGCGKTTVLRCLAGLETPNSGSIHMDGQLVFSSSKGVIVPPGRRGIGMVFQSYALWPHMSVGANVAFGLETQGVAREELKKRVSEALEIVGIGELTERYPSELSGGQQQRVALARALVTGHFYLMSHCLISMRSCACRCDRSCSGYTGVLIAQWYMLHMISLRPAPSPLG